MSHREEIDDALAKLSKSHSKCASLVSQFLQFHPQFKWFSNLQFVQQGKGTLTLSLISDPIKCPTPPPQPLIATSITKYLFLHLNQNLICVHCYMLCSSIQGRYSYLSLKKSELSTEHTILISPWRKLLIMVRCNFKGPDRLYKKYH